MGGQLKYPDDYDIKAFPAGKPLAVSRFVSIAIMTVFLAIIFVCSMILWAQKSVHVHPFLVSINPITGQWDVVGHYHTETRELSTVRSLQESVIGKFVQNWFNISSNETLNNARWASCDRATECNPQNKSGIETHKCSLFCLTGDAVYGGFIAELLPNYQKRFLDNEQWQIDMSTLQITPIGTFSDMGGTWQIRATINSSKNGVINILGYVKVANASTMYPETLGYYVQDFNAYKMN